MKKPDALIMGSGIAAGTLAAALPNVFNILTLKDDDSPAPRPQKIKAEGGKFTSEDGSDFRLKILGASAFSVNEQDREKLHSRFGPYGMAQITAAHEGAMLTGSDIKHFASLGFNCIRLVFSYTLIFPNGKISKTPDFSSLNRLLDVMCRNGMYAVLTLTDARTFEKKEKPSKAFADCAAVLAAKYENDNAVIMLDLKDPSALKAVKKAAPAMQTGDLESLVFTEKYPRSRFIKEHFGNGENVMFEPFKSGFVALITVLPKDINFETDSYEDIKSKYASLNENCIVDDLIAGELKEIFGENDVEIPDEEKPKKFKFTAAFRSGKQLTKISN